MTEILATVIFLFSLFFLLGSSVWVGLSLIGVAWIGIELFTSRPAGDAMITTIWTGASSWTLTALPLFIWMGEILYRTRLSEDMFKGLSPWMRWLPGGLLHTNIAGCTLFAAVSGSSAATLTTVGKMSIPELRKRGYPEYMIIGTLAGAATLGLMIPPSLTLIVYGVSINESITKLLHSSLTSSELNVPEGHYEEEQMKQTVVPNRNAIFASILYGYALSIALKKNEKVKIALGVHSGDHEIYPDCRPEFYDALENAFKIGNWESDKVAFYLPYLKGDKQTILRDAQESLEKLNLNFDTIFANTNTSYNPDEQGRSSGKSGADIERILAFNAIGRRDPVPYVDSWPKVLEHAIQTEKKHKEKI